MDKLRLVTFRCTEQEFDAYRRLAEDALHKPLSTIIRGALDKLVSENVHKMPAKTGFLAEVEAAKAEIAREQEARLIREQPLIDKAWARDKDAWLEAAGPGVSEDAVKAQYVSQGAWKTVK